MIRELFRLREENKELKDENTDLIVMLEFIGFKRINKIWYSPDQLEKIKLNLGCLEGKEGEE